jgi:tetratricopeptide (TPR) repeat protein
MAGSVVAKTNERRDFFISHAGVDQQWAEWIGQRLIEVGYTVELDVWEWAAGTNFIDAMRAALERADRVLAVYTDAYFAGRYAQAEHTAAYAKGPGRIIPVIVEPCTVPDLYGSLILIDLGGADELEAAQRLLAGVATPTPPSRPVHFPGPRKGFPASAEKSPSGEFPNRLPPVWNVPVRNPFFTGRVGLLADLYRRMGQTADGHEGPVAVVPLQGMGGVGKTQLAIEYAYRHASDYQIIWWVNAEDTILTTTDLVDLADALALPIDGPTTAILRQLWQRLHDRNDWLLIYDNVDDATSLADVRPPDSGRLLLTSRDVRVRHLAELVEVGVFARAESITLLQRRCPRLTDTQADQVAEALGDLPLAVEQAGCFLTDSGLDVDDYLDLLTSQPDQAGLADPTLDRHPGLVAVVAASSIRLTAANAPAAAFLNQVAFCAPEPLSLTPTRASDLEGGRAATRFGVRIGDVAITAAIVRDITRLGLMRHSGTTVQAHRLVQALLRTRLTSAEQASTRRAAQQLLSSANPGDPNDPTSWHAYAMLTPHVQALIDSPISDQPLEPEPDEFRELVISLTRYLHVSGQNLTGRHIAELAQRRWAHSLGRDHPNTLRAATNLAVFLWALGDLTGARALDEDALDRYRRVLGEDHPDTLRSANNLATRLESLGEYAAARDLLHDTLARRQRVLGTDHPDALLTANNLAVTLEEGLGEYAAARDLHQDTFARYRRTLGANHPDTLRSATSLAAAQCGLGNLSVGRDLLRDTLTRCRRVLGVDHPDTLRSEHNLGLALAGLHEYAEARDLFEDVFSRRSRLLGPDHHLTLAAATALAACLLELSDRDGARSLLQDALTGYRRTFGEDHKLTRDTARTLESLQ